MLEESKDRPAAYYLYNEPVKQGNKPNQPVARMNSATRMTSARSAMVSKRQERQKIEEEITAISRRSHAKISSDGSNKSGKKD